MTELPDLSCLTHDEKDALIRALWAQVQALTAQVQTLAARVAELKTKLGEPPKTPDNSSLPPSKGQKPNRPEKAKRHGPRPGSMGRMGGGRALAATPDETVTAKPVRCTHCQAGLAEADHVLHGRYDKIDLPQVAPVVTRVERYAARRRCRRGLPLGALLNLPPRLGGRHGPSHQLCAGLHDLASVSLIVGSWALLVKRHRQPPENRELSGACVQTAGVPSPKAYVDGPE